MIDEPICVCQWDFGFGLRSAMKLGILKSFVSFLCLFSFFKRDNFSVKGSRRSTVAPVHKGGFSFRPESCRVHSDRPLIGVARPFGERNFCQAECVCYVWDGPDLRWLDK